jgi:phosphoglycolate phosphatase-like HAD superfamily hydrolase
MADTQLAVVLDVDGTLVDSNYEHIRAWYAAFLDAGVAMPQARIHQAMGMGGDQLIPHLLGWQADEPRARALAERHGAIFKDRYLAQVRPLPAATDVVRRLAGAGFPVALASSAQADELDHYITLLDIRSALAATVSRAYA